MHGRPASHPAPASTPATAEADAGAGYRATPHPGGAESTRSVIPHPGAQHPVPPRRASLLHPATELVLLASALLIIMGVPSPLVPAAVLLGSIATAAVSPRIRFVRWLLTFAALAVPMLIMVGVIQGLFYPGDDLEVLWRWGAAALTVEGLSVALQLWLRVAAMIAVCALFAFGSDSARTFDGMIALRAPLGIAYVCATALSLVPLLRAQVSHALEARAARGWNTTRLRTRLRLLPGILAGLVTAALVQLDQRHDTLEQRGFGRVQRPAALQDHSDGKTQRAIRWIAPAMSVVLVVLSVTGVVHLPAASELLGVLRG
ncbi:energy-coupling factor transporter transmembrane component T family protein [Leucobacter japonicus]|uniref:energy-coupling factor transporter transmembrane component T family protein n=1 Tax=Leucobacter japonicus TaxID=1461259 RepID=UPI000AB468EA|nr:energy-coupling factor transporter transmembrane component T [Leucobacter japonicus]